MRQAENLPYRDLLEMGAALRRRREERDEILKLLCRALGAKVP